MDENLPQSVFEHLHLLFPYFSGEQTPELEIRCIGEFIDAIYRLDAAVLLRLVPYQTAAEPALAGWSAKEGKAAALAALLRQHAQELRERLDGQAFLICDAGGPLGEEGNGSLLLPLCFAGTLSGLLLLYRSGGWSPGQRRFLLSLSRCLGVPLSHRSHTESESFYRFVFNTVMDQMKANLYITDPDTDRILFMNRTMRETFGVDEPVGKICWQVFQKDTDGRCPFCPVDILRRSGEEFPSYQWEERNSVTGRVYRNYDSLIRWLDGTIVHFQQSLDVTELRSASIDELSEMLTRRAGREALQRTLEQVQAQRETVTICLYDVNLLKEINDLYGHAEGDRLISTISGAAKRVLTARDYAFRLSGDEFVLVFYAPQGPARQRMNRILELLREEQQRNGVSYEYSFCYGLVEIPPEHPISLNEALILADERMYEQKRQFHIRRNGQRRSALCTGRHCGGTPFTYDAERLYDALVQSTDDYLYVCNMKTGVFRYPQAMVEEFGLPGDVIENAAAVWGAKVHESDRAAFLESNQEIADGRTAAHCVEYRAMNRHGQWVWLRCRGHLEFDDQGEPSLFAGFISRLGQKNKVDQMTGLCNRLEFEEQVYSLIDRGPGSPFWVMVLGIDNLRHINDLYNRSFGDEVIRIAAQKVANILPQDASLYRLDGDEFAVVSPRRAAETPESFYRKILYSFANQQEYNGRKYYCTLSAGCVSYPDDAENYLDLIKYAGYSLEHAKKCGKKRCVIFSSDLLVGRTRALGLTEALRESVENDFAGFTLCYQPVVDASSRQVIGAEALARWEDPRFGQVPPSEFIPLLEQSGLIIPVGKWILRRAARACRRWTALRPGLRVSVNLSYLQLIGDDFPAFLQDVLAQEHILPQSLIVELTEGDFARESRIIREAFDAIRSMGVQVSMDDFGTGYSSLGILKEAPADIVKIDRAFIRDICASSFDATFIRFIVALCHDVRIEVCLEGVETEEVYRQVRAMGLDYIQGFLFGRPMAESAFEALLNAPLQDPPRQYELF